MTHHLRIATWNAGWITRRSGQFGRALDRIAELDADILALTETTLDLVPGDGHALLGGEDWGYPRVDSRYKVVLWSRWPIKAGERDRVNPPGRDVSGTVHTPHGPVRVHAVCVPWRDAHVSTGRRDASPWSEHLEFVTSLQPILASESEDSRLGRLPVVIAGDFNQRSGPNSYVSPETRTAWSRFLEETGLEVATPVTIIDRIALSKHLESSGSVTLDPNGISDHSAVAVEVTALG